MSEAQKVVKEIFNENNTRPRNYKLEQEKNLEMNIVQDPQYLCNNFKSNTEFCNRLNGKSQQECLLMWNRLCKVEKNLQ